MKKKFNPVSIDVLFSNTDFISETKLKNISGKDSLKNFIEHPFINRIGLSLAGFYESLLKGRLHLIGFSEMSYLRTMDEELAKERFEEILKKGIPGILISSNFSPPDFLVKMCREKNVALLLSPLQSNLLINKLTYFLSKILAIKKVVHGTLVDIYGVGVLIVGPSGIGKSESALELISRGHRLIADDLVSIREDLNGKAIGEVGRNWSKGAMEVKSIGLINTNLIFGLSSWEMEKEIDLVIKLKEGLHKEVYLGESYKKMKIINNIKVPTIEIEVEKGRNLALIIEVAVKAFLLNKLGYNYPKEFIKFQEKICKEKKYEER